MSKEIICKSKENKIQKKGGGGRPFFRYKIAGDVAPCTG